MSRLVDTLTAGIRAQRSAPVGPSPLSAEISVLTPQPATELGPELGPIDAVLQTSPAPVEVQHTGPISTAERAVEEPAGKPDEYSAGHSVTNPSGPADLADPVVPAQCSTSMHSTSASAPRRPLLDTDLVVSPFALSCSVFGWTADGDTSMRILDRHRDLGGNFLDTADSYATGRSEVLLGTWMRTRRARESTVIATKIGRNRDFPGLSPQSIIGAVHASLERLGTDSIDLLYLHLDDKTVPLEESLGTIDSLMRAGLVRNLAAANFSAERLMEARVLAANGLPRFVALQTQYNLVHRAEFESALSLVTRAQGLAVMPYFALAHGFLTGKFRTRADVAGDVRGHLIAPYLNRSSLRALAALQKIADARGVAPATIAVAWLSARGMFAPVASVSAPEQLDAIMAAPEVHLVRGEMHDLDRASAKLTELPASRSNRRIP